MRFLGEPNPKFNWLNIVKLGSIDNIYKIGDFLTSTNMYGALICILLITFIYCFYSIVILSHISNCYYYCYCCIVGCYLLCNCVFNYSFSFNLYILQPYWATYKSYMLFMLLFMLLLWIHMHVIDSYTLSSVSYRLALHLIAPVYTLYTYIDLFY